jgi:hypothetical protein
LATNEVVLEHIGLERGNALFEGLNSVLDGLVHFTVEGTRGQSVSVVDQRRKKGGLPSERRQRSAEVGNAGDVVDVRGGEIGRCVGEAGG